METIIVKNKDELKAAYKKGYDKIIVEGKLANDLKKLNRLRRMSAPAIAALIVAIAAATAAAPLSGGMSYMVAAPIAAKFGFDEVATIVLIVTLGGVTIIALFRDYDVKMGVSDNGLFIEFTKGRHKDKKKQKY